MIHLGGTVISSPARPRETSLSGAGSDYLALGLRPQLPSPEDGFLSKLRTVRRRQLATRRDFEPGNGRESDPSPVTNTMFQPICPPCFGTRLRLRLFWKGEPRTDIGVHRAEEPSQALGSKISRACRKVIM